VLFEDNASGTQLIQELSTEGCRAAFTRGAFTSLYRPCLLPRSLSALSHNEFARLDIETPVWHPRGISVIHRRARLEDEHPQLSGRRVLNDSTG
jgi:hypothetical protein